MGIVAWDSSSLNAQGSYAAHCALFINLISIESEFQNQNKIWSYNLVIQCYQLSMNFWLLFCDMFENWVH